MKNNIYLDNAATTFPKPKVVYDRVDKYFREECVNSGRGSYRLATKGSELILETRNLILELVNAKSSDKVVFSPSATIAANQVLRGLDWNNIKNVYVSPFEHNAIMRTLHSLNKQFEFQVNVIPFDNISFELLEDELKIMFSKKNPDLIIMSHVSNVTGYILPIEKCHLLAKKYNSINIVDCAQSLGSIEVDVQNELKECDFLIFAGHKSLYGPLGVGGFIITSKKVELRELLTGGTGSNSTNLDMPENSETYFESGSYNMLAIVGLNSGLRWIKNIGIDKISNYKHNLTNNLLEKIKTIDNIELYIGNKLDKHIGVISFNLIGYDADEVSNILDNEYGILIRSGHHCAPIIGKFLGGMAENGTIRVSISYFNTENDIDAFIDAISSF